MSASIPRVRVHRAFTLMELLVVIAIIGVLSAIVLAALNESRSKGRDAAVKQAMSGTLAQAEVFFQQNGNRYVVSPTTANTDVCRKTADGSTTSGAPGVYYQIKSAADAVGAAAPIDSSTVRTQVGSPTQAVCHSCPNATGWGCSPVNTWAAAVPLKSGGYYCVDSNGYNGYVTTPLASGQMQCT
ncbi:MAG TPA: type II secretion system protein [Candidatus Paceibacterota bacterium]